MRVALDTNVLVSAFTTRGICADVLTVVLTEHQLVLGETILTELRRVLVKKMKMPVDVAEEADALLRRESVIVSTASPVEWDVRDPDDAQVLGEVIEALADVLVTGDRDLTELSGPTPVEILTPRGFWEKIHTRS